MLKDEMEIIRAVSVKLDERTVFVLTYQYHTEKDPDDPEGRRNARERSRYRMLGRVMTVEDADGLASELFRDANRLGDWKWPDDPGWGGRILYSKDSTNRAFSCWIRTKIRKAVNWETYLRIIRGFKRDTACDRNRPSFRKNPELMYTVFTPNAVYDRTGYACSDGSVIGIEDREALLSKVGQNVWKEIQMKLVGPRTDEQGPSLSGDRP